MVKPLHGKRIVITRSPDLAEPMCAQLAALGAIPICLPVIDFVPLPAPELTAALANLTCYDWLIFTSRNAVHFFWARLQKRDWNLGSGKRPLIAAVGEATGRVLAEKGVVVDYVPHEFTGEQLALGLGDVSGQWILLPRAKIGRPEIVELLRERGAVVDEIALYETVTAVPTPDALAELDKGVDVITFTSPSSVRNFLDIVKNMRPEGFSEPFGSVACIGPSTAAAAERLGLTVAIVPDVYTIEGLISAVSDYFEKRIGDQRLNLQSPIIGLIDD